MTVDNDEEFTPKTDIKQKKVEKPQPMDNIDDIDSLRKLEPMLKGSGAIKAFLNKKSRAEAKK